MSPIPPSRIVFWLFDGFSNLVLASAVEPLRALRDLSLDADRGGPLAARGRIDWRLASLDGAPVVSSSGIAVAPDGGLEGLSPVGRLPAETAVVLVAGYGARRLTGSAARRALGALARRGATLGGLDMGAWPLAAAGLLDGRRATIHWQELEAFAEAFPSVLVEAEPQVVEDGRLTAGGASATLGLMLRLIRARAGDAAAFEVSTLFLHDAERGGWTPGDAGAGAEAPMLAAPASTLSPALRQAVAAMRRTLEEPPTLAALARRVGLSERTLDRRFRAELGLSPGRYQQLLRLAHARTLVLETDLALAEIATRTGFASASTLSRAFAAAHGRPPGALRRPR